MNMEVKLNAEEIALRLDNVLLFDGLDIDSRVIALKCLKAYTVTYCVDELIWSQEDNFSQMGILLEGEVCLSQLRLDGCVSEISILSTNMTFGEDIICAGLNKLPYMIVASKETTIAYIDGPKLIDVNSVSCIYRSRLNLNMLKMIAMHSVNINKKVRYLNILSLKKRVATYLLNESDIAGKEKFNINMNREKMANYLNGTRPAISKILMEMKKEEIVKYKRSKFEILDKEKLIGYLN